VKFLIDTNVFIPLEPTAPAEGQALRSVAVRFAQRANECGYPLYVHPAQMQDILGDRDEARRDLRKALLNKYPTLPNPPSSARVDAIVGAPERSRHDWVDHQLLAALCADAADTLVTEDVGIHRKAKRLGLHHRVAYVAEAVAELDALSDRAPIALPAVEATKAYNLDAGDEIFRSVRQDYPEFDVWLTKCKREHRQAWIVRGPDKAYAGVSIVNREDRSDLGLHGKTLKVCMFKISDKHAGYHYGELLLRDVLNYAQQNAFRSLFVEVFPKQERLIAFLHEFGFYDLQRPTRRGETRLAKALDFTADDVAKLSPLEFNRRFGPSAIKWSDVSAFVVPIKPKYHDVLFPEASAQVQLFEGHRACGNALRKAYLCNSVARDLQAGSILAFYRSEDLQAITVIGVVEETLVSNQPAVIARYVGKRTVYPFSEIQRLCEKDVLAILFRQARVLYSPIALDNLLPNRIIAAAPQSITKLNLAARKWIQNQLQ
jgi:ribosomal protein S18 acetylase RimI-like enzyme